MNGVAAGRTRGAKAYFSGSIVAQLCVLLRYTVLARLVGPEQLGLAATLILTAQFFESVSDSGSDRFLIQDREGDAPRVQRLVQLLSVGRGMAIACMLVVFAGPISRFYGYPVLAGGLVALAVSPLIAGFLHFDLRRMQRHNDFSREAIVMVTGEVASLVVTVAAAIVTRDFTAAIWGMVARSLTMVVVSWWKAERPYAIGYSAEHARRLTLFALPLMANGLLLFFGLQADRLLIGRELGAAALGHYSAILLLIYYPGQMLARFVQTIHLPLIAAARDDANARRSRLDALASQVSLLATLMVTGFVIVAPFLVPLLYGTAFQQPVLVVALIGILQTSRFLRIWPTTTALAAGRSGIVLINNVVRLIAFPLALAGLWFGGGLVWVMAGFAIGEFAALLIAVMVSNRAFGLRAVTDLSRVLSFILCCGGIIATVMLWPDHLWWAVVAGVATLATEFAIVRSEWPMVRLAIDQVAALRRRGG